MRKISREGRFKRAMLAVILAVSRVRLPLGLVHYDAVRKSIRLLHHAYGIFFDQHMADREVLERTHLGLVC